MPQSSFLGVWSYAVICSIYTHVQVLLIKDINYVVGITFDPIVSLLQKVLVIDSGRGKLQCFHSSCFVYTWERKPLPPYHMAHMSDRICTFSMEMYEYVCTSFMETYAVANDVAFLVLFK